MAAKKLSRLCLSAVIRFKQDGKPNPEEKTGKINRGYEAAFLNKMCDLQTFTNFFFPATIFKEQYDLLAETSFKSRRWAHSNASNVLRRSHSDPITPRSAYA
jgi:hypothetical protein